MSYRIPGIDVHKKMLTVVVADVEVEGEYDFERWPWATRARIHRTTQSPARLDEYCVQIPI